MTFVLIVKNRNGVIMAEDRRIIDAESNQVGQYTYYDEAFKMVISDKHKIGVCLENHMWLGNGYCLQKSFEQYLNNVKQETAKGCDLTLVFLRFPAFFIRQINPEDKKAIVQNIKNNNTYLYVIRWCDDAFEWRQTKVKNLFFLAELYNSILQQLIKHAQDSGIVQDIESYAAQQHLASQQILEFVQDHNLVQTKKYSFEGVEESFVFSSDHGRLTKICPNFKKELLYNYELSDLKEEVKKSIIKIIKSSPYFGGNPMILTIDNHGNFTHENFTKIPVSMKLFSREDSALIRDIIGDAVPLKPFVKFYVELEQIISYYLLRSPKVKHGFFSGQLPRNLREINLALQGIRSRKYTVKQGLEIIKESAKDMGRQHPILRTAQKCYDLYVNVDGIQPRSHQI